MSAATKAPAKTPAKTKTKTRAKATPKARRTAENSSMLSYSKITTVMKCGLAYDLSYIKKIKPERTASYFPFGNSVHDGVKAWYGSGDAEDRFLHQQIELGPLVEAEWLSLIPKNIKTQTKKVMALKDDTDNVAAVILLKRPELKNPRATKEYLTAGPVVAFNKELEKLQTMTDKCKTMKWAKGNNAYKDLIEGQEQAVRITNRWINLPRPPVVEDKFTVKIDGVPVRGVIDQIRMDPDANGEILSVPVLDMKTGKNLLSQQMAFIQSYIYYCAAHQMEMPDPTHVEFFHTRLNKIQKVVIDLKKHDKIAKQIFNSVLKKMDQKEFAPEYGMGCDMCDYQDLCDKQLGLWTPGEDGVVEIMPAAA